MKPDTALFSIVDLEIRYDRRRPGPPELTCPSLEIFEGETLFLTGPNGSGKTTFLKALNSLVPPCAGSIGYRGGAEAARRETVYLHQLPYIFSGTIGYNAAFACRAAGLSARESRMRAESALRLVGLSGYEDRRNTRLSGGEAQRVALARTIASGAKVLLLDEPTASADARSAILIAQALRSLVLDGRTLVVSTHDPAFMADLSTMRRCRNIEFSHGRVVSDRMTDSRPSPEGQAPERSRNAQESS